MKKLIVFLAAFFCVFFSANSGFANNEHLGIIPGSLAWFTETIVEQWTLTEDADSEVFEQIRFDRAGEIDGDYDFTPSSERYNRKLIITLGFINLGTEVYHFDNASRLETSIKQNDKVVTTEAVSMTSKTVIAPNGRIKKSVFEINMTKDSFTEAYNVLYGIEGLSFKVVSDKMLIKDSEGRLLLNNVDKTSGYICFLTKSDIWGIDVYLPKDKKYTYRDVFEIVNKVNAIKNPKDANPVFVFNEDSISSVLDVPNVISEDRDVLLLFSYNNNAVNNDNTSEALNQPLNPEDIFRIAIMPSSVLREYLPGGLYPGGLYPIVFRVTFVNTIAQLPESIAPKKYQEVNNASSRKESFLKLKELAESGDSEAIDFIAKQYNPESEFFNDGFLFEDYTDALAWFKGLARQGNSQAQLIVGLYYENGLGVEKSLDKAIKCYKIAAEQDNGDAMVCYANAILNDNANNNLPEAVRWLRKAAEIGNRKGQCTLALILIVSKDDEQIKEGMELLTKAANSGYPAALYFLAMENWLGKSVPKNDINAFIYMEQAAEKNYPNAFNKLGLFYKDGIGVVPNMRKSVYYYKLGATENIPESMYWYGNFLCEGKYVEKNVQRGYELIKNAAQNGISEAMYYLGMDYFLGKIAQKDDGKAFFWMEKAANKGNMKAVSILGDFYSHGVGVSQDIKKAVSLYKLAADKKNPLGMFRWGVLLYEQREGASQTGLDYIKAAANAGLISAQEYLNNLNGSDNNE